MIKKKQKAATSSKATTLKFDRQNQSYKKAFPLASKINLLLGKSLLALQNPENNKQSRSQLLSVVEDLLTLKADLGLYRGINRD